MLMPMLRGLRRAHFPVIALDPPWAYKVRSAKGLGRSAENHYDTMSLDDIAAMPIGDFGTPSGRIFCWITGPFMAAGAHIQCFKSWGYEPVSIFSVWVKPTRAAYFAPTTFLSDSSFAMMMGHTSRQNAEYVIEGRRGSPQSRKSKSVRQLIIEPVREHSRKPDSFFSRVEAYCDGPRLELFGRQRRRGWTVRGNQVGMFK